LGCGERYAATWIFLIVVRPDTIKSVKRSNATAVNRPAATARLRSYASGDIAGNGSGFLFPKTVYT
jgi:hypothetical protein